MWAFFFRKLAEFLDGKPCQALIAPVDIFLPDDDDGAQSVVQPDVLVVCHPDIIKDDGIHGAPDFIAEVLSDSTAYKDLTQKKALYERSGVREYWILNPDSGSTLVYVLENGRYLPARELLRGNPVLSSALDGFSFTVV
ncbi:MAG TPA: Uma2 family endonuclease [Spirochaetales bacterium]|nr:Uma2 family endonuclease [Spirochaetales bacterium]